MIVPTFSLAKGRVLESTLDVEAFDSKLVVDSLRLSWLILRKSPDSWWSDRDIWWC